MTIKNEEAAKPAHAKAAKGTEPANVAPAKTFSTSGAPVQVVPDVDPDHPAVDADPRSGTSVNQNKIDFNDPTLEGHEAVEKNLKDQAKA